MSEAQIMVLRNFEPTEVSQVAASLADFLCWSKGHNAALHADEKSDRGIMGVEHVRRAREILERLHVDFYQPTPIDRFAQEIHDALKTPLGMRAVAGVTLGEDAADQLAEAVEEMRWSRGERVETPASAVPEFQAAQGLAPSPGNFEVGKRRSPGWAEETDKMLRRVVTEPAAAKEAGAQQAEQEPMAYLVDAGGSDGPLLYRATEIGFARTFSQHHDLTIVSLYAQPQPALEPDWPREITDSMAESYAEILTLALQGGENVPGAARAILTEFMRSHRPGPLSDAERDRLRELEEKLDALTVPNRSPTAWRSWTPGEQGTRLWANEEAARTAAGPDGRVTPLYDAPPREPVPADFAEVPVAFAEEGEGGLNDFWRGHQRERAEKAAAAHGKRLVPLYRSPEPAHLPEPSAWLVRGPEKELVYPFYEQDLAEIDARATGGEPIPLYRLA